MSDNIEEEYADLFETDDDILRIFLKNEEDSYIVENDGSPVYVDLQSDEVDFIESIASSENISFHDFLRDALMKSLDEM